MTSFPDGVPVLTDGVVTLRPHPTETGGRPAVHDGRRREAVWSIAADGPDQVGGGPRSLGTVSLSDEGSGRAEAALVAHSLGHDDGHLHRALEVLLSWAFDDRQLSTVTWWAARGDWVSRRLAWRLGFSFDGTVRRWLPRDGDLVDAWVGSLAATDARRARSPWLEAPRIVGRRVVLREYADTDADRVVEACSDPLTSYWLTNLPSPYTLDDARTYVEGRREQLANATGVTWAVVDPGDDLLVGTVSLFDLEIGESAEVGYWMHPAARGRGLMREACGLAVRHAFVPAEDGGLGLHGLRVMVAEGNHTSYGVVAAHGFVPTGRIREEHRMRDGSRRDLRCYDLLAAEYLSRGSRAPR